MIKKWSLTPVMDYRATNVALIISSETFEFDFTSIHCVSLETHLINISTTTKQANIWIVPLSLINRKYITGAVFFARVESTCSANGLLKPVIACCLYGKMYKWIIWRAKKSVGQENMRFHNSGGRKNCFIWLNVLTPWWWNLESDFNEAC